MADVVRYIGFTIFCVVLCVADYLSPLQLVGLSLFSIGIIIASFVEWKKWITYKAEKLFNKMVEKAKKRLKPVELDDWYLPVKEKKNYFYDLKEMRG